MVKKHYRFYMDESETSLPRADGMNCFCYAGVLIAEEDIEPIRANHKAFCEKWGITYPLHNVHIRGRRNKFVWLYQDKNVSNRAAEEFLHEYHEFMTEQPYAAFGSVWDKTNSDDSSEFIFTTTFVHTIEKVVEFLFQNNSTVSIYIESSDKQNKQLRMCLDWMRSSEQNIRNTVVGDLEIVEKENPNTQIADFIAFTFAKSMYEKDYRPFRLMIEKKLTINVVYSKESK